MRTKNSEGASKALAPILNIKEISDTGAFVGYGSVFGNIDSYGEVVEPGAFKKSLIAHKKAKTFPKMFWQHRADEPLGRWTSMVEDDVGLLCTGQLNMAVTRAKEARAHLADGDIDGLSIGYREVKVEEPTDAETPRKLLQLNLLEVSIVSLGANQLARVQEVKSQAADRLEKFAKALRDGEPLPIKEFEDILREAGVPKSMAVTIASVGYAKAIRSDSGGSEAAMEEVRKALANFGR
jgi:HK97 family phage prohead protease